MKARIILLLISSCIFILPSCEKSDERLNKLIYGSWYLRESMGSVEEKYVFKEPNLCEYYSYTQALGLYRIGDDLTFVIDDALLTIYSKDTIFQQREIRKLNHFRLHLKYDNFTYVYKNH